MHYETLHGEITDFERCEKFTTMIQTISEFKDEIHQFIFSDAMNLVSLRSCASFSILIFTLGKEN